jgi:hypothetical protein
MGVCVCVCVCVYACVDVGVGLCVGVGGVCVGWCRVLGIKDLISHLFHLFF